MDVFSHTIYFILSLNMSTDSDSIMSSVSLFHSLTVFGKKDCLNGSEFVAMILMLFHTSYRELFENVHEGSANLARHYTHTMFVSFTLASMGCTLCYIAKCHCNRDWYSACVLFIRSS